MKIEFFQTGAKGQGRIRLETREVAFAFCLLDAFDTIAQVDSPLRAMDIG